MSGISARPDDLDVDYRPVIDPSWPFPLLYLSCADERGKDLLIPIVKRYGLPILRIDGPENAGTLQIDRPDDPAWKIVLGPGRALTVHWPGPRPLVYGGGMSTPAWRSAALQAEACVLLVGPPRMWNDSDSIHDVVGSAWKAGGALGLLTVELAGGGTR